MPSPLYKSAKISDYRFRKVLWAFVCDASATEAAQATGLSVNSVHAIFRKIRVFFFEAGLFQDYYGGQDPVSFQSANPFFEKKLLKFHFGRIGAKQGLKSPDNEPPYHFAESCWRFDFKVMAEQRQSDHVLQMMQAHLLEIIRLCGPIGAPPRNKEQGLLAVLRQADQRILWLERNAPGYTDQAKRAELRAIRDDDMLQDRVSRRTR